jgi:hypothetical protein
MLLLRTLNCSTAEIRGVFNIHQPKRVPHSTPVNPDVSESGDEKIADIPVGMEVKEVQGPPKATAGSSITRPPKSIGVLNAFIMYPRLEQQKIGSYAV